MWAGPHEPRHAPPAALYTRRRHSTLSLVLIIYWRLQSPDHPAEAARSKAVPERRIPAATAPRHAPRPCKQARIAAESLKASNPAQAERARPQGWGQGRLRGSHARPHLTLTQGEGSLGVGVAHQPADEEVADEEGDVEPRTSGAGASRRRAAEERHARHRRRSAGSGGLPVAYTATGRTEALAACRYPPVAHDVSPPRPSLLPAAPTACHGPVGTPAGYGSGEWHPRRSRCRPGCVDAFAAAQGLRDAGLSSLIVLDVYSPIAEVPSPNQAHDLISSDAQKVQRPTADAMPASSPFTIDLPHHLGTRGHCSGCRA